MEHELVGAEPTPEAIKAAAQTAAQQCDPVTDQRGSKEYKRHIAGVLTERVLTRAAERAQQPREV